MAIKIIKLDSETDDAALVFRGINAIPEAHFQAHLADYEIWKPEDYYKLPVPLRMVYIIYSLIAMKDNDFIELLKKKDEELSDKFNQWVQEAVKIDAGTQAGELKIIK